MRGNSQLSRESAQKTHKSRFTRVPRLGIKSRSCARKKPNYTFGTKLCEMIQLIKTIMNADALRVSVGQVRCLCWSSGEGGPFWLLIDERYRFLYFEGGVIIDVNKSKVVYMNETCYPRK